MIDKNPHWVDAGKRISLYVHGWRVGSVWQRHDGWAHGMRGQAWPTRDEAMQALWEREVDGPMVAPIEDAPRIDPGALIEAASVLARDEGGA